MARHLEDQEQMALMRWASLVHVGTLTLEELLVHCPNGGWRNPREAARFKAMGVKAGIPDVLLPLRNSQFGAGWWELKVGRNKPTDDQLRWHALLRAAGHYVQTYWHWAEAAQDILRYLERGSFAVIVRAKL